MVRDVIAGLGCLRIGSPRFPNCLAHEGLDIGRRHPGDRSGFGLAALQECLRYIIPIPHALLVGMARAHRIAAIVEDETREDRGRPGSGELSLNSSLGKFCLDASNSSRSRIGACSPLWASPR